MHTSVKHHSSIGLLIVTAALFFAPFGVHAKTVFFSGFESADVENTWELDGLWHRQEDPHNIRVSNLVNPDLVELPDPRGELPTAYKGNSVLWYGASSDGTFLGNWNSDEQKISNGGYSIGANSGSAVTPAIDLRDESYAKLSFWTWWEIEGVDVDTYDLMKVLVSTDDGATYTEVLQMNPLNDVDAEAQKPYSSGGLGEEGVWTKQIVNLSKYAGEQIRIKFMFDTVDHRYNGFRGLLIDNVKVTDTKLKKVSETARLFGSRDYCGGKKNGEVVIPRHFYVNDEERVQVKSKRAHFYITPFGKDDIVYDKSKRNKRVYLNEGHYTLWTNLQDDKSCSDAKQATASVILDATTNQKTVRAGSFLSIHANRMPTKAKIYFKKSSGGDEVKVKKSRVLDRNFAQIIVPSGVSTGENDVIIETPNGKRRTLRRAIIVSTVAPPRITSVSPTAVEDKKQTTVTITGKFFKSGAVATIGGVPLLNTTVTRTKITGKLPKGAAPGYQNVVVMNADGQRALKMGAVRVKDNSKVGYTPEGEVVEAPVRVSGVAADTVTSSAATVTWTEVDGIDHYTVQLKQGKTLISETAVTEATESFTNLDADTEYTVIIRAVGEYRGGTTTKKRFTTLSTS